MTRHYLVTGATGLLGNNLVRLLRERGDRVRALVRATSDPRPLSGLGVDTVLGHLGDSASIQRAIDGVDCVIHAAGDLHIGWQNWDRVRQVNVRGTAEVAGAARRAGIRLVHVSSVDALPAAPRDGRPVDESTPDACKVPCTYVVTKREADREVQRAIEQGLDAVTVHPGFMLGPWDWKPSSGKMLLSVAHRWTPVSPTGGMSGCDVRDVALGTLVAADRAEAGRRFILAGENLTYHAAWQLFARVTRRRAPWFRMGPLVRWSIGYGGDLWGRVTGGEPELNSAMIRMSELLHYYSSDLARRELGYHTRPFEQSVRDAWQWFLENEY